MARRPATNPLLAVGYLRVSTDDQHLGPEAQRAAIIAWAERVGVTVIGWHVDAGVSGAKELDDRPGLLAAFEQLRGERAGVLVVARRDRLARDAYVAATLERHAAKLGAIVRSADGVADGNGAADGFLRGILDAASAYERELIRSRTRSALAVKRARGERIGGVPFGFMVGADGESLERCEHEQEIIALAVSLRASGLTVRGVVAALAERGVVGRSGKPLVLCAVARLVK